MDPPAGCITLPCRRRLTSFCRCSPPKPLNPPNLAESSESYYYHLPAIRFGKSSCPSLWAHGLCLTDARDDTFSTNEPRNRRGSDRDSSILNNYIHPLLCGHSTNSLVVTRVKFNNEQPTPSITEGYTVTPNAEKKNQASSAHLDILQSIMHHRWTIDLQTRWTRAGGRLEK